LRKSGAKVIELKGVSVADSVARVVREKHITQVIFGRSIEHGWRKSIFIYPRRTDFCGSRQKWMCISSARKD
jgi:K+-sensing histidine kinase KdpD